MARVYALPRVAPWLTALSVVGSRRCRLVVRTSFAHLLKNGPTISEKHVGTDGSHRDESTLLRWDGIANR